MMKSSLIYLGKFLLCPVINNIHRKRKIDKIRGLNRVYPFLITGTHTSSYPVNYELYSTVRDWRGANYFDVIQTMLNQIYNLQDDQEFSNIWNQFKRKYFEISTLPTRTQIGEFRKYSVTHQSGSSEYWRMLKQSISQQIDLNIKLLHQIQHEAIEARLYLYTNPSQEDLLKDALSLEKIKTLQKATLNIYRQIMPICFKNH